MNFNPDNITSIHMFDTPLLRGNDVVLIHDKGKYIHKSQANPIAKRNRLFPFYQEEADKLGTRILSYIKK